MHSDAAEFETTDLDTTDLVPSWPGAPLAARPVGPAERKRSLDEHLWERSSPGRTLLAGHLLRHAVVVELAHTRSDMTVADLCAVLEKRGFATDRRMSAAVSDSLRTPVARGLVWRVGRGRYRIGAIDPGQLTYARRVVSELSIPPSRRRATGSWRLIPGPAQH